MLVDVLSHPGRAKLCFKMLAPIVAVLEHLKTERYKNNIETGSRVEDDKNAIASVVWMQRGAFSAIERM